MNVLAAFKNITTFILDVDGVLTDGKLILLPNGIMARSMNVKDGYALQLAIKKGYKIAVISGGNSVEVIDRLHKLGVKDVYMSVTDKVSVLTNFIASNNIVEQSTLYIGDDIPDKEVMQKVAVACCPADAVAEIREISHYISPVNGGLGCVRDIIEKVLKVRGDWNEDTHIASK